MKSSVGGWRRGAGRRRPRLAVVRRSTSPEPDQVVALLRAAAEEDARAALGLRLAAVTGARQAEVVALAWHDLPGPARGRCGVRGGALLGAVGPLFSQGKVTTEQRRTGDDVVGLLDRVGYQVGAVAGFVAVLVTGPTTSADFPTTASAFDPTFNGGPMPS